MADLGVLDEQIGPLPVWAWAVAAVAGIGVGWWVLSNFPSGSGEAEGEPDREPVGQAPSSLSGTEGARQAPGAGGEFQIIGDPRPSAGRDESTDPEPDPLPTWAQNYPDAQRLGDKVRHTHGFAGKWKSHAHQADEFDSKAAHDRAHSGQVFDDLPPWVTQGDWNVSGDGTRVRHVHEFAGEVDSHTHRLDEFADTNEHNAAHTGEVA